MKAWVDKKTNKLLALGYAVTWPEGFDTSTAMEVEVTEAQGAELSEQAKANGGVVKLP